VRQRIAAPWCRAFVLSSALAFPSAAVHATDPPWLEQLPSVDKVLADTQGADREDTLARQ
jgi:hypothetical protein